MQVQTETYQLWGKQVRVQIPKDNFPTQKEIKALEAPIPGCQHGWFYSNGVNLHYRKLVPQKPPRAVCVFMHGIQTHFGVAWIINGRKLNMSLLREEYGDKGFLLYAMDMRGHGYSEGERMFVQDYKTIRNDYSNFARWVSEQHPELPLFLHGHSFGGCLAIHVAQMWEAHRNQAPASFAGSVLVAPAVAGELPPTPLLWILRILAALFPLWVPFFMPNPVSPDRIWQDPKILAVNTDPTYRKMGLDAAGSKFRLGTAMQLVLATDSLRRNVVPRLTSPFCAIHGDKDKATPIFCLEYLNKHAKTPAKDRALHCVEGGSHDLLGDPCAEQTVRLMTDFIEDRIVRMKQMQSQKGKRASESTGQS